MILIVQTTFGAYGGIPSYNRTVCRALDESDDVLRGIERRVLVGTDGKATVCELAEAMPGLNIEAFSGNRAAFVRRALAIALSQRIDLLLVGHVNYAPLGWMLKRFQPRLRYGVILYGIDAWQKLSWIHRNSLRQADFMISISDFTRQRAAEVNGLKAERIHLLHNALEWKEGGVSTLTSSESGAGMRLLSVCRLDQSEGYKGIDHVIEVLPEVTRAVPNLKYTVIGAGSDLARHKELAKKMGVADRVHFLGFVSDEVLQAHYRECDLFVMPSAAEGFGFVFLEAMKCSKPIVAANSGGTPEVVQDDVTGVLLNYGDKEKLARALVDLCRDPDKRARLGSAGYQRLQNNFTFEHFRRKLHEIILSELPAGVLNRCQKEIGLANSTN